MNDERMAAIIEKHGAKGIGTYLVLLVELRSHPDYRCGLNTIRMIARTYKLDAELIESLIHDYGLFDKTGEESNAQISSLYLNRVMENLEKRRKRCSEAGKKRTACGTRDANGRFTSLAGTNKHTDDVVILNPDDKCRIKSWKEYLAEALNDKTWKECQAMHSGLGEKFIRYEMDIVRMFMDHAITHGRESTLLSVKDVKFYFANFVRRGTVTCKRIAKELNKLEQEELQDDPHRFEDIDPVTKERSYYGNVIPVNAPPRPNDKVSWNYHTHNWE